MTIDEFRAAIRTKPPLDFCREHLFDQSMWLYSEASGVQIAGSYADLKVRVGDAVDINPNNVALVGSAKYGFSMSPDKRYRPFDLAVSDVDIVIVSEDLFASIWREIREAISNGYTILKRHHAYEVIMRFIVLRGSEAYLSGHLRETARVIERLKADLNKLTRLDIDFKYRIYASWKDVELYHTNGINALIGMRDVTE